MTVWCFSIPEPGTVAALKAGCLVTRQLSLPHNCTMTLSSVNFEVNGTLADGYSVAVAVPSLEVIKLEFILRLKIKHNDWLLADTCPQAASHCALF